MMTIRLTAVAVAFCLLSVSLPAHAVEVPSDLMALYKQGRLDEAMEKAKVEMEKRRRAAEYPYFIATCYERKLDFAKAEEYYKLALDRKPNDLETLYRYGRLIAQRYPDRLEEAKELFQRGLDRAKKDREKALFEDGLGLYYLAMGDHTEAGRLFQTARFHDPDNCDYQMHLGDAYYERGAYASAITSYNEVLAKCDSLNSEVHFRLGRSYLMQKRYNEALQGLGDAIRLDSSYVEAYNLAGKIFILSALSSPDQQAALEQYKNSIWMFRKQIDFGYETGEAHYYLAKAFRALGGEEWNDSAAVHFELAIEDGSDRPDLYVELGLSYSKSRQYEKAIEVLSKYEQVLLSDNPEHEWTKEDAELFLERGRAYASLKDSLSLVRAVADLNMAMSLDSTEESWLSDLGFTYYNLGRYDSSHYANALGIFEARIAGDSTASRAWLNLASVLLKMRNWDRAVECLKKVVEYDPENCNIKKMIASTLSQEKRFAESREYYEQWGQCDTATYEAEKWIGFTYLISQPPDGKRAVPRLTRAYEQMIALGFDECHDEQLVTWIAQGLAIDKKYEESRTWIKRGLRCYPGSDALTELRTSVEQALEE